MALLRVAVVGAAGRMGSAVSQAVEADPDLELVARVGSTDSLAAVVDAGADVAVEFTVPSSVKRNVAWLLSHGVHTVVGTTGLGEDDLAELAAATGPAHLFVAPNFAIGAVLLMEFCRQAAAYLPHVEIVETHHERKIDAPSGTALRTAALIAEARTAAPALPGPSGHPARGSVHAGVAVHSLRLPGALATQEVVFGGAGQTLSLRHDTTDRAAFLPGVLLAIKRVPTLGGVTVGLESLL